MVNLARLHFSGEEMERFSKKAEHVLEYIEQLKEVDTSKVEPTSHAVEVGNALREDKVEKFDKIVQILKIAPNHQDNLFEVPKVIDEA